MKIYLMLIMLSMATLNIVQANPTQEQAVFAGGCFWCMEHTFDEVNGVTSTTSGFIGGHQANPTYEEVSSGDTGHTEAVKVIYNPRQISYQELLDVYWRNVDPTTLQGQFCDIGSQYRPEIFYYSEEQRQLAEASKTALEKKQSFPIKVRVTQATTFYPAEQYHQDYHHKNPLRYKLYRFNCGRDKRLDELWNNK
jgi:peptide-methionine (S)-S-oxide reductase